MRSYEMVLTALIGVAATIWIAQWLTARKPEGLDIRPALKRAATAEEREHEQARAGEILTGLAEEVRR